MKKLQGSAVKQASTQISHEAQSDQQNSTSEGPVVDSGSVSSSNNETRKVSHQDIEFVQNLIERCLQLYMNRDEVVKTLSTRARIEPGFTTLVNNLPMGYPVLQQPPLPATHINSMSCSMSSSRVVKGIPASGNFHPIQMNAANETASDPVPGIPTAGVKSEVASSPPSVASNGHFSFAPEISGMSVDASTLHSTFTSDVSSSEGLQLGPDGGTGNLRESFLSLAHIPWSVSLTDLTVDLPNLEDIGALGNYSGSPFLQSDILLDSPEQNDLVEEFFVDNVPGPDSQSDEEKKP
ncbi:uncharacterized protein LOC100257023 isoform X4 [Vitis vinifera]|uniref:uncharacterized protein LOC100257023 isoform X4 n=1 Tax=Vitis vinifera TaxID=29760 RepID=UPI002882E909|nr:uncharacterized protein LOC100257023 isoform X4 [Vitis vinifera]